MFRYFNESNFKLGSLVTLRFHATPWIHVLPPGCTVSIIMIFFIPGFCHHVNEICAYTEKNGGSLPTFRENLLVPSSRVFLDFHLWWWDQLVVSKRQYGTTILWCIKSQKSGNLFPVSIL